MAMCAKPVAGNTLLNPIDRILAVPVTVGLAVADRLFASG